MRGYERQSLDSYKLLCKTLDKVPILDLHFKILKHAKKEPPTEGKMALVVKDKNNVVIAVAAQKVPGSPKIDVLAYSIIEQLTEKKIW